MNIKTGFLRNHNPFWVIFGVLLFLYIYHSTFTWLFERYTAANSYYSHGFLIPIIVIFLIYKNYGKVKPRKKGYGKFGFYLILFSQVIHIFALVADIHFISGLSLILFIWGVAYYFYSNVQSILFPLTYLLFMIPLPLPWIKAISLPVKFLVVNSSSKLATAMGIPVLKSGFYIHLPNGMLLIGDPCSGLRSLISFLALGALIGYLHEAKLWIRVFLFLLVIPVALFANMFRVIFLIFVSYFGSPSYASPGTPIHDLSGISVFILGLLFVLLIKRLLPSEVVELSK